MNALEFQKLKFPIGPFVVPDEITQQHIERWIIVIEDFPMELRKLVDDLSVAKLQWKYRPDGWMIKQVVHHCADSHMNSLIRFKLALTEHLPEIKPYQKAKWAELADSQDDAILHSMTLLDALHYKWAKLLNSLSPQDLTKQFIHPEMEKQVSLAENIGLYAWHCEHHRAHIKQALVSKGIYSL